MSNEEKTKLSKEERMAKMSAEAQESIKRTLEQLKEHMVVISPEEKCNELVKRINDNPDKYSRSIRRIVEDLSATPPSEKINNLIRKAMLGNYGDTTSPYLAPKSLLVMHLDECGCHDLARKAEIEGYYDDN